MNITAALKKYIEEKNTDYAVLINGTWGSGKTYYLNNILKNEIETITSSYKKGNEEKYKLVYVSLYGVNTLSELRHKIFISTRKWADNKILNVVSNAALNFLGKRTGISVNPSDLIDLIFTESSDKVYVFDDLERIETKTLNEILGYINTLSEHNNIKVIIVADEDKLNQNYSGQGKAYKEIKEKLIRYTFTFRPDISKVFDEISSSYTDSYSSHLITQKDFILELFKRVNYSNVRTLKFLLDIYKEVFKTASGLKSELNNLNQEHIKILLSQILYFLIIATIEYKTKGSEVFDTLQGMNFLTIHKVLKNKVNTHSQYSEEEKGTDEIELISRKYVADNDPYFEYSDELKTLIMHFECGDQLKKYVYEKYRLLANNEEREEKNYYNQFRDFSKIEDSEWPILIANITRSLENGKYTYDEAYTLFRDWEYILESGYKIPEPSLDLFKKCIEMKQKVTPHIEFYDGFASHIRDKSDSENVLISYIIEKNNERRNLDNITVISSLFENLTEERASEMDRLIRTDGLNDIPVFIDTIISPQDFFQKFVALSNKAKDFVFSTLVTHRYNSDRQGRAIYINEKPFFEGIVAIMDQYLKGKSNKLPSDLLIEKFKRYAEKQLRFINGEQV